MGWRRRKRRRGDGFIEPFDKYKNPQGGGEESRIRYVLGTATGPA